MLVITVLHLVSSFTLHVSAYMAIIKCVGCFYFHIPEGICFAGFTCTWLHFARFHLWGGLYMRYYYLLLLCYFCTVIVYMFFTYLCFPACVLVCLPFLVVCLFVSCCCLLSISCMSQCCIRNVFLHRDQRL
jgi:hypothetical protein